MCPYVYRFAQKRKIVVTLNTTNQPVPVLGSIAVALGIAIPAIIYTVMEPNSLLMGLLLYILVLLLLGIADDIKNLSPSLRFCVELFVVGIYTLTQYMINGLYGLWNIESLPLWISVPLSIIAGVGIINSINLIDGVDGYSSGFGIVSCVIFGTFFWHCEQEVFAIFLFVTAASLLPFFFYNVFGKKKMYIGDGGTLMIGAIMSSCVFYLLSSSSPCTNDLPEGMGIVAFCLSILCIPVFDTLRVMFGRIARNESPFKGDMTHLHHLFLNIGFSHSKTSLTLISINLLIISIWWVSYQLGAGIDLQLYIVVALGLISTFGLSRLLRHSATEK